MKIAVCSDVHLEFGELDLHNEDGADVLILSGDILIAKHLKIEDDNEYKNLISYRDSYRSFMKDCSERFKNVIYVAGNHEFYGGGFYNTLDILRSECAKYSNVHFLENASLEIDDVTFIGCSLWTDMNKEDPLTMLEVPEMMNDYSSIRNDLIGNGAMITSRDVVERHKGSLAFIKEALGLLPANKKVVVVTHHAPSKKSTHPRYVTSTIVNGAYSSELSEFILDNDKICLWTHGHTHAPFSYEIGKTRVVCNPRGYMYHEDLADIFKLKYVNV